MVTSTFDTITRHLGSGVTRRSALRNFLTGAAAAVAGGALLQTEETSACGQLLRLRSVDLTH